MALDLSFQVDGSDPDNGLTVVSGTLTESLNECTSIILTCVSPKEDTDPDKLMGKKATLKLSEQAGQKRTNRFDGIIDHFRHTSAPAGNKTGYSYELVMHSPLFQLGYALSSRVFRDKSIPEIVEEVLNGHNLFKDLDFSFKLIKESQYAKHEHVVQYNSTDLGFITHKLASVGINYYFTLEQSGDAEEKLVMCDHHSFFQDCYDQAVDYHPAGDFLTDRRFVNSFRLTKRYMPGKVTLQGYQNSDPHKEVNSSRSISQGQSPEVRYFKGLKDSDQAKQVAKIREEEIASRLQDGQGKGNLFGFRAGTKFSLNPDPRDQKGAKYLITKVRHNFSRSVGYALSGDDASLSYDNTFYFVEDETPIRPQFITHRLPQTPGH